MAQLALTEGDLNYVAADGNRPAVMLVHGLCCDHTDWRAQLRHLDEQGRAYAACDLRGHGASRGFAGGHDIDHFARDVVALLDALGYEHSVLVGHSMGCRVALQAALLAPARFAGLVLVDGSRFASGDATRSRRQTAAAVAAAGGWDRYAAALFEGMFIEGSPAADRRAILRRARAVAASTAIAVFDSMVSWDAARLVGALDRVRAPVLVVQSTYVNENRQRVPIAPGDTTPWLELIVSHLPEARVEIVHGAGHFVQREAPSAVNRLIDEFIAAL